MSHRGCITIERASREDADAILALQKLAYLSEAEILGDFTIEPLRQTRQDILAEFACRTCLKAEARKGIIGSVRAFQEGVTCHIGKLIVHPDQQHQGLGTRLLLAAEALYPESARLELFTSHKSERNLRFYAKRGYTIFKEQVVSDILTLVFLEKWKQPRAATGRHEA